MISELEAIAALQLDWVYDLEDVWQPSPVHVEGVHTDTRRRISDTIADLAQTPTARPLGVVVRGQAGTGKTHLVGRLREQVQGAGGYFFLIGAPTGSRFWENVVTSMITDLFRPVDGDQTQLSRFLRGLCGLLGVSAELTASVVGDSVLTPACLKDFIVALHVFDRQLARECQHTLRALVLVNSRDLDDQTVGDGFLLSVEEQEPGERARRGMIPTAKQPPEVVKEISRLLALTGPSVFAVDQVDTIVAETTASVDGKPDENRSLRELNLLADGLLVLRERTERALCVLACLPVTWIMFEQWAVTSVRDRFRAIPPLGHIDDPALITQLLVRRFHDHFQRIGFEPPYPTWPVAQAALDQAPSYTPRELLQRIERHIQSCLLMGTVKELESFAGDDPLPVRYPLPPAVFAELDTAFAGLRSTTTAITPGNEDSLVPELLAAGLTAWIIENGGAPGGFALEPKPSARPPLHARLSRTINRDTGEQMQWAFRAVTSTHGNAALHRIQSACVMAGLTQSSARRRLFLLRNVEWSRGVKTQQALAAFEAAGGVTLPISDEDVATFTALGRLLQQPHPALREWLNARRPASTTALLIAALANAAPDGNDAHAEPGPIRPAEDPGNGANASSAGAGSCAVAHRRVSSSSVSGPPLGDQNSYESHPFEAPEERSANPADQGAGSRAITVGRTVAAGRPARIDIEVFRKHVAIFAGSGSGKTVLIRRLLEECALRGVSSIVLDPNNDLARLGDAWPSVPSGWHDADDALAAEYLGSTDVVLWTPRRAGGRPLSLQPLPDFVSIRDDQDEFDAAIDAAVATLAVRAGVDGRTSRANISRAVLRDALEHFARGSRTSLSSFADLLADLPDGVTALDPHDKHAKSLAQDLRAAMVNDPLFGGDGQPVDPAVLLTPPAGRRARISVISLVGLPNDDQRQSFVNQLQMALFAWAKKNPAVDRSLGGLFVMDEAQIFAPSGTVTACTASTLALASQARKYGLGLLFATQHPKGLHNSIPGNATTQFFGRLSSPVQIDTARAIARNKGGDAPDIGQLGVGEFYATSESLTFEKIRTPLCLSHHPASPLTDEEVVRRARGD
ncbi:helicase HerA domain-containing protein [Frankia sp. Cj5]|uniref:helicase HerA domain-containing protein n=1 Tax=Frankia sp. Cj5 TaxID=2880978 RepID=UPI001EF70764|nr:DUF87 domain-containing protein [Frankia sp. Cj5]